jgi:threonine dehydratase
MSFNSSDERPLHIVTPLLHSAALKKHLPMCKNVYMKMENCQNTGSFKIRGFGYLCQKVRNFFFNPNIGYLNYEMNGKTSIQAVK